MESEVLIDSNVFIDSHEEPWTILRRGSTAGREFRKSRDLRDGAGGGAAWSEVSEGVPSRLNDFMDVMVNIPSLQPALWSEAAALAWKLDRKGLIIPGTDVVIAASAIAIGAAILTSDAHFSESKACA